MVAERPGVACLMNRLELHDEFREQAKDFGDPPLFSDSRLEIWDNEAQREACRRGKLLVTSTANYCAVTYSAGDPMIELDEQIVDIKRIRVVGQSCQLSPFSVEEMDAIDTGWEDISGTPTAYVTGYETGYIRLYPSPSADGEVQMTVYRLPQDMEDDDDEPEIRKEHHLSLVQWMLFRAYSTQDADGMDQNKAQKALAEFSREFGTTSSARNEEWQRQRNELAFAPIA